MLSRLSLRFPRARAVSRSEYRAAIGQSRAQLPNKSLRVPGGLQTNVEERINISRQATSVKTFDRERSPSPTLSPRKRARLTASLPLTYTWLNRNVPNCRLHPSQTKNQCTKKMAARLINTGKDIDDDSSAFESLG